MFVFEEKRRLNNFVQYTMLYLVPTRGRHSVMLVAIIFLHWEFPGDPVVRHLCFHCQNLGSVPGQETKISKAVWCGQYMYICIIYIYESENECVSCSVLSHSLRPHETMDHQVLLSVGFSRQEYWSGLPFPFSWGSSQPRDWIHVSCIAGGFFFTIWATKEVHLYLYIYI